MTRPSWAFEVVAKVSLDDTASSVNNREMRLINCLLLAFLTFLPTVVSGKSTVYRLCKNSNSSHDICYRDGTGKYKGHRSISSFVGNDAYVAYFYSNRNFEAFSYDDKENRTSIVVSDNGLVGRNMAEGEYFPNNKNFNNTLPEIRAMFLGSPDWRRKTIQRNLKRLELYNSTIDGLWGRNTFNAIIGYNAVFKQTLLVGGNYKADQLLNAISSHNRFDYKNGKLKSQVQGCSSSNPRSCPVSTVCSRATTGNPKRWMDDGIVSPRWVAEAKRRNLSCGVKNSSNSVKAECHNTPSQCSNERLCAFATTSKNSKRVWEANNHFKGHVKEAMKRNLKCGVQTLQTTQTPCNTYDLKSCSAQELCRLGTTGSPKRWSTAIHGKKFATEARSRGLYCGVNENIASAPSTNNCSNDPTKCGAVELCQKAVETKSGKVVWRTDVYGKRYVAAAQSIGLPCNVDSENPEKTYRVANGTGFFVSDTGYVVTNQHVISGCNEVQIHSGGDMSAATVISQDKINDLALLKTKMKTKSIFSLAPENPYLLQDIIAAGFPFGESVSSTIKVTKGVVSSLSGLGDNSGQIQIDAALQPGNSGGPIIDENGNVVGVAVAKLDLEKSIESFGVVPENVNFGIKLSSLKTFLDDNNVNYSVGKEREIKNSALGKLATEATVLLSCWMTEARIETMQNSKAMFKEIFK